jgi:hypothetical protein
MKEVLGLNWKFGRFQGFICKFAGALVKRICNLEHKEGFKCKIEGLGAEL